MAKASSYLDGWVLIWVCIVSVVVVVHGQDCRVGSDADEVVASRAHSFYLNTQDPAPCTGTLTEFQYCYYRSTSFFVASYDFTFALYRRDTDSESTSYTAVSQAFTTGRSFSTYNTDLDFIDDFACASYSVDEITVQAGDMIGVCVYDPPDNAEPVMWFLDGQNYTNRVQLDVIGEDTQGSDRFLMSTGTNGCGDSSVPDPATSLSRQDSRVMHVYADITPLSTIDPPPTTPTVTMGTPPTTPTVTIGTPPTTPTVTMGTPPPQTTNTEMGTSNEMLPTNSTSATTSISSDTTTPSSEPVDSTNNVSGVVAAVVVILLLVIITALVVFAVVAVLVRRKHLQKNLSQGNANVNTDDGIDNAVYSPLKENADYQELESTPGRSPISSPNATSPNHYEMEHVYESEEVLESYYAEVGPLLDLHGPHYETPQTSLTMSYRQLLEKNLDEDIYGSVSAYQVPATQEDAIYSQLKTLGVRYIHRQDIRITRHLGSGQFGSVEQGVWKRQGTKPVDVALKSLTKTSEEDKVKFLQEAAIMAQFKHPNVILLHGVVAKGEPIMLAAELAERGDLREFLLSMRPDPGEIMPGNTAKMLLTFSQQVALGMQYLSAKGFVHRDLAARNVLVTANNVCKVADFGMSRDLADENYYVSQGKDKIPVKWTAPEAIHYKKYSTASDVWAYGCLLYEIWSVGHKPFEYNRNNEVLRLVDRGQRLAPPPGVPKTVYHLMLLCWHPETSQRPGFRDVVLTLARGEEVVLCIPKEDSSTHPLAGVLGAPLEAGENMYQQLQNRYR